MSKPEAAATILYIRCVGGEAPGGATLAPRVGPLGLNAKKLADDIAATTTGYMGLKVTVKITVMNRQPQCEVVASASTLLIKALNEPTRNRKTDKNIKHEGDLSMEDVLEVSRTMRPTSMAKEFRGTVKEILGTAFSVGCTVEGMSPFDMQKAIDDGEVVIPEE